jgi:3-hydroxybutyryl-CoA dehydratase
MSEQGELNGLPPAGQRIASRTRTVTEADVATFSHLTGDLHPVHLDAEWAKSSQFGERIAPGMLVLSFSIGLVDLDRTRVVALRRLRNVVFKRPTRFGEAIHVDAVVTSARALNCALGLVDIRWTILDAAEKKLVRASIEVLWSTRPAVDQPITASPTEQLRSDACYDDGPTGVFPF